MPLNGRDFSQLALLQPGVVMSRSSVNGSNVGQGIKISVAGSRPSQNLFTLDGTAYNDALNNTPSSAVGLRVLSRRPTRREKPRAGSSSLPPGWSRTDTLDDVASGAQAAGEFTTAPPR